MLRLDRVSKRYAQGHTALQGISLELEPGSMHFLTGHSGAGKSTLLKLATAMERPSGGRIFFGDQEITRIPRRRVPHLRRAIGTVFQDHKLLYDRTVHENVALALRVANFPRNRIHGRVQAVLTKVGLEGHQNKLPITLSGGEQQRVAIARALVNKPDLLLADEPTGNLDQELADEIMDLFYEFHQFGMTVLVATHDLTQPNRLDLPQIRLQQGQMAA
ncbi:cell division ATP-binding protein FtsE [Thiohalorhabdus methylotrophus]|uniref:Cell division ATP-binding protein FtsE n=1 Tax=Thiohalorhabdus methylotrophus TaxID=3242694 RepID=A0ABV4TXV8_9GAMM